MDKKYLDIDQWNRKEHFHFFRGFDEPFFGVCVDVDVTHALLKCKEKGISFFLYYLHKSLRAANEVFEFRLRIEGERVRIYDRIDSSSTISREDGTFGFSHIPYHQDFALFVQNANEEIKRVKSTTQLMPEVITDGCMHMSAVPWLSFTSVSHSRHFARKDSVPKISFGKIKEVNDRRMMPFSVHVHHALMDGSHVGKYVDLFSDLLNEDTI